jgi:hypothetical protein
MMDANAMRSIVDRELPDIIIPEIEAIDLDVLFEFEEDGYLVTPNAAATHAAMNRERIRELIVKSGVKTGAYAYTRTDDLSEFTDAVEKIGYPCFSKAIMSSSGKGSYFIESRDDIKAAMDAARYETRGSGERAIIEEYIPFNTEVTELAITTHRGRVRISRSIFRITWMISESLSKRTPYLRKRRKGRFTMQHRGSQTNWVESASSDANSSSASGMVKSRSMATNARHARTIPAWLRISRIRRDLMKAVCMFVRSQGFRFLRASRMVTGSSIR